MSGREHTAGTFCIPESADFLKRLSVILNEHLPAAARHLFHDRYLLVDVLSTLLSIKIHYSLTRQAKDAALYFLIASTPIELYSMCALKGVFDDVLYVEAFPQLVSKQDHQAGQNSLFFHHSHIMFALVWKVIGPQNNMSA